MITFDYTTTSLANEFVIIVCLRIYHLDAYQPLILVVSLCRLLFMFTQVFLSHNHHWSFACSIYFVNQISIFTNPAHERLDCSLMLILELEFMSVIHVSFGNLISIYLLVHGYQYAYINILLPYQNWHVP